MDELRIPRICPTSQVLDTTYAQPDNSGVFSNLQKFLHDIESTPRAFTIKTIFLKYRGTWDRFLIHDLVDHGVPDKSFS